VARPPAYALFDGVPIFSELKAEEAAPDLCAPPFAGLGPGLAAYFGMGALVLHKDRMDGRELGRLTGLIARAGFGAPAWQDDQLLVYTPPPAAPPPAWANLDTGSWYARETDASTGGPLRWMGATAVIRVWRPTTTPLRIDLRMSSLQTPRRLAVQVGDNAPLIQSIAVTPTLFTLGLPAGSGQTAITLRVLDPPATPLSLGLGPDTRTLSLALTGCTLR
jgi:hypothetical protein